MNELESSLRRNTSPAAGGHPEVDFENTLRPRSFEEFVGQELTVGNLRIAIQAARERGEAPDHILLSGPPGLGKTSLARILARELDSKLYSATGPAIVRAGDLVGILTQLERGDVLFIDEIHRVPPAVEEYLYSAMEDFSVDLTLDQGPNARVLPLRLECFTLVGATTRDGLLSAPFRGRFGLLERLEPYPPEDLMRILARAASILQVELPENSALAIAERSRGTPRICNRLLRRVRDFAQVSGSQVLDRETTLSALQRLGIDDNGLEEMDRQILRSLARKPGQALGLKTIAAEVGEAEDTIEEVFEPHLLRSGFLQKTARGRMVTALGCRAIGIEPTAQETPGLFD